MCTTSSGDKSPTFNKELIWNQKQNLSSKDQVTKHIVK